MSLEALWDPLVCSYDISHSGTQHVTITYLAASTVSWMVTHPSIIKACVWLTSVIRLWMVALWIGTMYPNYSPYLLEMV